MQLGIGLEFARGDNVSFEQAVKLGAEAGYRFVEPYVYSPASLELNSHLMWESHSGYHHLNATHVDIPETRSLLDSLDLEFSAFDAHSTLLMPHVGVPYVVSAIDLAAELGCPIVMSDEGPVPQEWMDMDRAFDVMCISIEQIVTHAQARQVRFAIELHNALTTHPDYLEKLLRRFRPNELGVNFDTGNSFLAGNDPVAMLQSIVDRVIHVHIKDISERELPLRGKVTGTRVGVAAGDGVVDLPSIVSVLAGGGYTGILSVECDTLGQAERSLPYLDRLVKDALERNRTLAPPRPTDRMSMSHDDKTLSSGT